MGGPLGDDVRTGRHRVCRQGGRGAAGADARLGRTHRAVFAATYWQLTTLMRNAVASRGSSIARGGSRTRIVEFDEEYRRQMRAWERGDVANVTPDYEALFAVNDGRSLRRRRLNSRRSPRTCSETCPARRSSSPSR